MRRPVALNQPRIGVDMGGTTTQLGLLLGGAARLDLFREFPTRAHRPKAEVLNDLESAIRELAAEARALGHEVAAVGVGLPAALSLSGVIEVIPNFAAGWEGADIAAELAPRLGLPVTAVNDARAFTLAEAALGAGRGAHTVLGITLGTGVGGGVVVNGRLQLGPSGKAGELGHLVMNPNGPLCGCGGHGCLETYASATALLASVVRPFLQGRTPRLRELAGGSLEGVTAELIGEAARAGDEACQDAIRRVGEQLGIAATNAVIFLATDRIVVGGGMAGLGELLLTPLEETLKRHARVAASSMPEVTLAELGGESGAIGAALGASVSNELEGE